MSVAVTVSFLESAFLLDKKIRKYTIVFFNEQRPAYSLGYLTPKQYKEQFAPAPHC